jgi:Flp pilus assembly protein TadG
VVRLMRRIERGERGAVAVEFIIILPILVTILFAAIEFGLALSKYETYVGAAREGARYAAVRCKPQSSSGCSDALIAGRVSSASTGYPIGPGSPSESTVCSDSNVGSQVTVSWAQDITVSIAFFGNYTMHPTIKAVFRCE